MDPVVGVLALQGAVSEHYNCIRKCGAHAREVKYPADLEGLNGLIIPGGESTTIGYLMRQNGLDEAIIKRNREGMALMGTCAGMVLLASEVEDGSADQPHLGLMNARVKRNAFGRQRESFETSLTVNGWETPVQAVFIRAPVITSTGPEVRVLSRLEEGVVAAQQGNLLALSFHPELVEELAVHEYFLTLCAPE